MAYNMASLGWKGCFLHVMPNYAVRIQNVFQLHSGAKYLQNIFERSHIEHITAILDLVRKSHFCLTIIILNIVPNQYATHLSQAHAAVPTKHARIGHFVHMMGDLSISSSAQKSQRSVLGRLLE
jgi:hypothetical protein